MFFFIPQKISNFAKKITIMHFVFSYDLSAEGQRRTEIESKIQEILEPYRYTKKLYNFYIIHIDIYSEWETILNRMSELTKAIPEKFHFIMSPAISGDQRYNGILPKGEWDEINDLSK